MIDASEILHLGIDEVLVFMGRRVSATIQATRMIYHREVQFANLFDGWCASGG
ncbi:MAG: hypothetical protein ABL907_09160 [Hyphomicrobium sp.]